MLVVRTMKGLVISLVLSVGLTTPGNALLDGVELIMDGNTIGVRNGDVWMVFFSPEFSCFFPGHHQPFQRGDTNGDSDIDAFDAIHIFNWLAGEATEPLCLDAADVHDDGDVDMFDAIRILFWLGGELPPPLPPCCGVPENCGSDPTQDNLSCLFYQPCSQETRGMVPGVMAMGKVTASRLEVGRVKAGVRTIVVPVELVNAEPLVAFSFAIRYDPYQVRATAVDFSGLKTEEFDLVSKSVDPERGEIRFVAMMDTDVQDGMRRLSVGKHRIARILFEREKEGWDRNVSLKIFESLMAIDHRRSLRHQVVHGAIEATHSVPEEFSLSQNYPNPFNPMTVISYTLASSPKTGNEKLFHAVLRIYDIAGHVVKTLVNEHQAPGEYLVTWDGRNDWGEKVATGIYLYRLKAGSTEKTKRMVLIR